MKNEANIRAYVDGELPAAEAARLERELPGAPELAARIRFEEQLRERVAGVLSPVDTPPALAASVREAMAPGDRDTTVPAPAPDGASRLEPDGASRLEPDGASRLEPDGASRLEKVERWWAGPPKANALAVAASLALVAGAVLFGVLGRPIDSIRSGPQNGLVSAIARHVSEEHEGCSIAPDGHVKWTSAAETEVELSRVLEATVEVFDLSAAGYRFVGAAPCQVPGPNPSGHLIYARAAPAPDGCPTTLLSVFLMPNPPDLEWALGADPTPWEWSVVGERPDCESRVAACTDGTLAYFLVGCDERSLPRLAGLIAERARTNGD